MQSRFTHAGKPTEPALVVAENDAQPSTEALASESTEPQSEQKKNPDIGLVT
jgi:hypothetical protein